MNHAVKQEDSADNYVRHATKLKTKFNKRFMDFETFDSR